MMLSHAHNHCHKRKKREQSEENVSTSSYNRHTEEIKHLKHKIHMLFTTLKISRFIPATLQQVHLTLLTHLLLSDLSTGQTVHQLVTFQHEYVLTFTLP